MSMRLPLKNKQYATLFSVYVPTLEAEPAEKDKFYSEVCSRLQSSPSDEKVIILGDFNAKVGQYAAVWKGVLGKHGVCNGSGCLLLELCTEQQLVITNIILQQNDSLKTTWMHPRSKHWQRTSAIQQALQTPCLLLGAGQTSKRLPRCSHYHLV
jgi:hypothetical protein